jgi:hypothetical protein
MRPKFGTIVLWGKSSILKNKFGIPSCMEETQELNNLQVHYNLKMDLVEHLWAQSYLNIG